MNIIESVLTLTQHLGVSNLKEHRGAWQHQIDEQWHIAINGHEASIEVEPPGGMKVDIPPFGICVWFNGWLAGLFSPNGEGMFAAGGAANEAAFVEAVGKVVGA